MEQPGRASSLGAWALARWSVFSRPARVRRTVFICRRSRVRGTVRPCSRRTPSARRAPVAPSRSLAAARLGRSRRHPLSLPREGKRRTEPCAATSLKARTTAGAIPPSASRRGSRDGCGVSSGASSTGVVRDRRRGAERLARRSGMKMSAQTCLTRSPLQLGRRRTNFFRDRNRPPPGPAAPSEIFPFSYYLRLGGASFVRR